LIKLGLTIKEKNFAKCDILFTRNLALPAIAIACIYLKTGDVLLDIILIMLEYLGTVIKRKRIGAEINTKELAYLANCDVKYLREI
jgi:hypothetical protein